MTMLYVGSSRVRFVVHMNITCSLSTYFANPFAGGFKEKNGIMEMLKDSPEAFSIFVD